MLLLALLLLTSTHVSGQYRTAVLEKAVQALGLTSHASAMVPGTTAALTLKGGQTVSIRKDNSGQIVYIGLPLFSEAMRRQLPSPVYDCLEYAALDRQQHLSENDLLLQKIKFLTGSWTDVFRIDPTDECTVAVADERQYVVRWKRDGSEIVSVTFPIDYELLNHSSRRELEKNFARDITKQTPITRPSHQFNEMLLQKYGDTGLYVLPGDTLLLASLNRNTYYTAQTVTQTVDSVTYEEERPCILVDRNYPAETMANLLISTDPLLPDAAMTLELQLSKQGRQTAHVTLRQFMAYCKGQGCVPYFVYDNNDGQKAAGSLLLSNPQQGYNHLVNLTCTIDDLVSGVPVFKGRMLLFIPDIRATQLFSNGARAKSNEKIFGK